MESQEVEGGVHETWISKRGSNSSVASGNSGPSLLNMSEASGSSSSQGRQGPMPTKRTLSESASVRQMGPSPVKRQYQASNIQGADDAQVKQLESLERKEASLFNQLLHQLQLLHKRCNEERHQIVEEQRRLAERLEQIDSNEKAEELAVREKNNQMLERVRADLHQLRQKMSMEGSSSIASSVSSASTNTVPSTSGGQSDLSNVSDIRRRLGTLDRQRQTLLEQLYAAIRSLSQEGGRLVDVQLHNCAPGREVAGSSTLSERGLPTSQQSEIAESNEQAQSSGEEDSEITSSSDVLIPQNVEIVTEHATGNQSCSRNQIAEPNEELEAEAAAEEEAETPANCKEEPIEKDAAAEEEIKKKEERDKDLDLALSKLKNIGSLVEEELQCSICNELLVAAVTINCAHSFCKHCLGEWKKQRAECPMCRMPITAEHRSVTLDSLISTMVGQLSLELQQRHKEVVEERAALEAAAVVAANASSSSGTSSSRDNSSSGGGPSRTRSHHHNYNNNNNNHWQPLPPPHYHHHHHHHNNFPHHGPHAQHAHVPHYPPHAHSHAPHTHTHAHAHSNPHPPHAHVHTHVHPLALAPPVGHAGHAPQGRHNTPPPPPPRAPLALALSTPGLHSLQNSQQGGSQGLQGSQGSSLQGLQNLQSTPGSSQGPGPQASQGQPHDGRAPSRRRHGVRGPGAPAGPSGSGAGLGLVSSASSSGSSTEEPSDSTSSYSSSGGFSSSSERTWFESDYGEYEDEETEGEPPIVPGIPGRYYGGYGVCFYCNQRGHWSNGCPVRFGF